MGTIAVDGCEIEAWNTMFNCKFLVPSLNASVTIDVIEHYKIYMPII